MGVTLERVQNKFACIIGELCSEPLLLSQFAIWVDLRISEYKSKGTISLDCSGSNPDPSWLKGHINPGAASGESNRGRGGSSASIRNSLPHKSIHSSRDSMRHSLYQNNNRNTDNVDNTESASERLSPDVVIKDDPDAIFPISIHKHDSRSPSVRKRVADPSYSADQDLSQQGENYYQDSSFSTPKMRRVDSASDDVAIDSPSNQSFMSVIGDSLQDSEDASQIDSSLLTPGDGQSRGGTNLPVNQRFSSPSASFSPMPSTSATPGSSGGPVPETLYARFGAPVPHRRKRGIVGRSMPAGSFSSNQRFRNSKGIRSRVANAEQKTEKTIGNIVGAVGSFESWLFMKHGRSQNIETFDADELDGYLAEFFSEVTKPHGGQYDPDSFVSFRSYIERFLKENAYPHSICRSDHFSVSQEAFKERRKTLVKKRKEKLMQEERYNEEIANQILSTSDTNIYL